jgi:hypothetical protein
MKVKSTQICLMDSTESPRYFCLAQTHTYNTTGASSSYSYGYSGTDQSDRVSTNGDATVYTSLGFEYRENVGDHHQRVCALIMIPGRAPHRSGCGRGSVFSTAELLPISVSPFVSRANGIVKKNVEPVPARLSTHIRPP